MGCPPGVNLFIGLLALSELFGLDLLNPQLAPVRCLEGIGEILCLVRNLSVAELHDAHCVCWPPLVGDCVFSNPEIPVPENPPDVETARLAGMMTPQGLQIAPPENSLARLRIVTDGIVLVNIVFRVCIAGCRRAPVRIQRITDLYFLRGLF